MYQPYQYPQPMTYFQQPTRGISGRVVASLAEVNVNDVPNDGSFGWFPSLDGSHVWSKRWRADGTIETLTFVPEAVPEPDPERDIMGEILGRLDSIETALKKKGAKNEG